MDTKFENLRVIVLPCGEEYRVSEYDESSQKLYVIPLQEKCTWFWNLSSADAEKKIVDHSQYCHHLPCWEYAVEKNLLSLYALKYSDWHVVVYFSKAGRYDILRCLLKQFPNMCDSGVLKALCSAQDLKGVKFFCQNPPEGQSNSSNIYNALEHSVREGILPTVKYFLRNHVCCYFSSHTPCTMLKIAAKMGHLSIVEYLGRFLKNKRFYENFANDVVFDPLLAACQAGKLEIVMYFCEHYDLETPSILDEYNILNGRALQKACEYERLDVVEYLCQKYRFSENVLKLVKNGVVTEEKLEIVKILASEINRH
jgi:hypothetical protein